MRHAAVLVGAYLVLVLLQPQLPDLLGERSWLLGLTPVLLVYAALRAPDFALMMFVMVGGLLHDLLLLHYVGMGPLLWGLTVFLVRSQRSWLGMAHWALRPPIVFVASLFYMVGDRLFFLTYHGFWSWNFELSFSLIKISFFNALISPLLLAAFEFILRDRDPARPRAVLGRI